jgi:HEAT repeat protein
MRTKILAAMAIVMTLATFGCGEKSDDGETARINAIGEMNHATEEEYAFLIDRLENGGGVQPAIAAWALGRIGRPQAIPELLDALANGDVDVRVNAAGALANYPNDPVRAALVVALGDSEEQVVAATLRGLSRREFAGAAPAIGEFIEGGSESLRPIAVKALAEIASVDNLEVFERLTADSDPDVRSLAVFTLGKLADSRALPTLIRLLEDDAWSVRANAAQALGTIGDPAARPHLEKIPGDIDQHEQVQAAAEQALEKLTI